MINCSTYIFGTTSDGYFQYPMDSLKTQLQPLANNFKSESQIAVFREPNLMYYAYMRRVVEKDNNLYFGICISINSMATYNLSWLFRLFESAYQEIVIEGNVLTVNNEGLIHFLKIANSSLLYEHDLISKRIKSDISDGEKYFEAMPPVNYSSYVGFQEASLSDGVQIIMGKITINNMVYVVKNDNIGTPAFNGLILKIQQLSEELKLQRTLSADRPQKSKQVKAQKFMASLSFLLLFLLVCLTIGFIYMYTHQLITLNI